MYDEFKFPMGYISDQLATVVQSEMLVNDAVQLSAVPPCN